jgi:regulator of sirC expression with transglutaminase-like and TPR domain
MNPLIDENKINSLIHLLEDEDEQVYLLISDQIMAMGSEMIPFLLDADDRSINPLLSSRLREMQMKLSLNHGKEELAVWKERNVRNLFQGLSILSKFQYPRLELRKISDLINKIRQDLWLEINDNLTALEKVRIMNHIFFETYGFKGNSENYFALENSFINDVLMSRKGNPLLLSSIYSIIAQSVNIPIYGVNLPRNYMLVYIERLYNQDNEVSVQDVLFYINPFNHGEIHSLADIQAYLRRIQMEPKQEYFLPCDNAVTITRCIHNIINSFEQNSKMEQAEPYKQLLEVIDENKA